MNDMSQELSAFFHERYANHARRISSAVELPNGWVLALSFERRRDNRGGAYTSYYATMVRMHLLIKDFTPAFTFGGGKLGCQEDLLIPRTP